MMNIICVYIINMYIYICVCVTYVDINQIMNVTQFFFLRKAISKL